MGRRLNPRVFAAVLKGAERGEDVTKLRGWHRASDQQQKAILGAMSHVRGAAQGSCLNSYKTLRASGVTGLKRGQAKRVDAGGSAADPEQTEGKKAVVGVGLALFILNMLG